MAPIKDVKCLALAKPCQARQAYLGRQPCLPEAGLLAGGKLGFVGLVG
jgi:hypothetical protein